jgi:hypothetical protein
MLKYIQALKGFFLQNSIIHNIHCENKTIHYNSESLYLVFYNFHA